MMKTAGRLLKLTAPHLSRMFASIALGFMTVASGIGLMSAAAFIIARAALQPPLAELRVAIAGVRAFGIGRGLLRYVERLLSHDSALRILSRLRVWTYEKIEPLVPNKLESYRSGDLLARLLSDVNTLENFFVRAIAPTGVAALTALAMTIFIGSFHLKLGLIYLALFLASMVIVPILSFRWTTLTDRAIVRTRGELFGTILDGLEGGAELLVNNHTDVYMERLNQANHHHHHLQIRSIWRSGFASAIAIAIANLSVIALLIATIPLVRSGSLTGIDLAVIVLANLASYEAAYPLAEVFQEFNRDIAAGERIFDLVAGAEELQPSAPMQIQPAGQPPRIDFHSVSYTYPDRMQPALKSISLSIASGQTVAIVGPSGSGKTTLAELLPLFRPHYEGEIRIDGNELRSHNPDDVRRLLAFVPQRSYLFHTTLRENLLLARPNASDSQLIEALQRAQLGYFLNQLPAGLDTFVGEHGHQFSAGERQRVSVARAILKDAPLLVLDEACVHLDADTAARLWWSLDALIKERSTLIISHQLTGLEHCDEILVLDQGRIIQRGSYQGLVSERGWFRSASQIEQFDQTIQDSIARS